MLEKLTVVVTTYNLENYILEALESIVNQKTDFAFKILIADDASTDRTVEIIRSVMNKYPDYNIEVLENRENQGSLKNSNRAFEKVKSKYLAFLDGDDYWIKSDFLQKCVNFLEQNNEYVICAGNAIRFQNGSYSSKVVSDEWLGKSYDFQDYLNDKCPFVHTSGIVLRNIIFCNGLPEEYYKVEDTFENSACRGETFRFLLHLEKGKMMLLSDDFSCYRIHEKGIWSSEDQANHLLMMMVAMNFYDKYWHDSKGNYFQKKFIYYYRQFMRYMLLERKLDEQFILKTRDTEILSGLLSDIAKRNINWDVDTETSMSKAELFINNIKKKFSYMFYSRTTVR